MSGFNPILARAVGLLLVFGSIGLVAVSFVPPQLPWARPLHVVVQTPAFGNLNPQAGVELGGVRVGSVEKILYQKHGAQLLLAIDPAYAPKLHADATATIQPHGLLGPKYVSLGAGSQGRMRDGGTIPESRTVVTTDFDQVLNSLQPDVRQNLQVVFVELGNASAGRGEDMNQALGNLSAASDNVKTATGILKTSEPDTTALINSSETFNRDVQNAPIAASIADTNQVLSDLVQVEQDLSDSIDHTAGTLQSIDVIMNGNSGNLAYVLAHAPDTVAQLNNYLDLNTAVINGVRPSLPNLLTAVVEGESVVNGRDANGNFVRVLAISGACSTAPDPTGQCSTPNDPAAKPAAQSGSPSPSPSGSDFKGGSYQPLSDSELSSLFLGG
jgi:virulence factor Mce-like protein